jgi:ElaB/YqjD/DUF883 family membrane-anchored ribosome-binding protein
MSTETPDSAPRDTLESLVGDWQRVMSQSLDGTEKLVKQRPWLALLAAFVIGIVFSEILHAFFGRRR